MWILFSTLMLVVGLVVGFVIGAETGESKAYETMRDPQKVLDPDGECLSPAERRRKANRPWT